LVVDGLIAYAVPEANNHIIHAHLNPLTATGELLFSGVCARAWDGRTRLRYHHAGRISVSEPNLQGLPRDVLRVRLHAAPGPLRAAGAAQARTEAKEKAEATEEVVEVNVRDTLMARAGKVLLAADYSQVELRILAHLSRDAVLLEMLRRGGDLHRQVAARCLGRSEEEVSEQERERYKQVAFGIVYGIGPRSLADRLLVSPEEAAELIRAPRLSPLPFPLPPSQLLSRRITSPRCARPLSIAHGRRVFGSIP
jgi:hypothetical protein